MTTIEDNKTQYKLQEAINRLLDIEIAKGKENISKEELNRLEQEEKQLKKDYPEIND